MGREAQRLHLPVKTQRFLQLGISCELGNGKNGTGDRQEAFTYEKAMFRAVWNKISSMQSDVSTTEFGDQKEVKTSESETVPTGVRGMRTHTSWYRRWTNFSNPFYLVQPPRLQSSMLMSSEMP